MSPGGFAQIDPHENAATLTGGTSECRIPQVRVHVDHPEILVENFWGVIEDGLDRHWGLCRAAILDQGAGHVLQEPVALFAGDLDHATCSCPACDSADNSPSNGDGNCRRGAWASAARTCRYEITANSAQESHSIPVSWACRSGVNPTSPSTSPMRPARNAWTTPGSMIERATN